eukprot:CAMPEP_0183378638 /NCGR_PEP_ID=MMETSP0164_2-20130417/125020_1 /TAXON_ID=221442 /ORGANISM="Coccolithus pelagicus ssp braarudi, Strain PLY182g" /LENGTH=203 /DNA_ID=CAMNT_0025556207 /DNA_START=538 /DNA_END=1149 /DNA_ORIENTATION=+
MAESQALATPHRISQVQMWRPWCLARLSNRRVPSLNASTRMEPWPGLATETSQELESMAARNAALRAARLPVIMLSYAELLWWPQRTLARLQDFMPCGHLLDLSTHFVPVMNVDIFKGNHWKVQGSLDSFAKSHPPGSCGYANASRSCIGAPVDFSPSERQRIMELNRLLTHPTETSQQLESMAARNAALRAARLPVIMLSCA